MENVLSDFCDVTSWHHAISSHHNLEVIKVEPDLDTESLSGSPFFEDPLTDETEDADPLLIKSAVVKDEVKQEELCDVTKIKEELTEEVTAEECYACHDNVEHSTNQQWHSVITADTSSGYATVHVGSLQEEDTCSETEMSFKQCGTQRNCCNIGSDIEERHTVKKLKHDSKKKGRILYKCKICSKSISRKENLVIHNRIHTGEKPFRCEICNKGFIRRDGLVRHTRIHTGDKPFSCEVCNKGFIQRGDLIIHTRTHTGEKPFKCKVCNKRFKQSAVLASHSRIHTGDKRFKCDVCNKEFTQHGGLVRHTRSHSGDKPFSCQVCNKKFAMRGDLVRHTRIHTRHKSHSYEGCSIGLVECGDLNSYPHTGENTFSS
ncbi:oocyte zinc finger protein XlCOF6.1-like isoform X1 [Cryptotermes secundus]|uniref:oocyte zinc finger protein XlCOF6.1-like isoform X1 n=1 Tax=Cryptotermes secundus TaxID=105785 RepID=UPI000CD7B3BB|nr:oocyte zinc finger protein XlCOF6.1-like isoform X1 [Cryptotermes secundus]XP_023703978.1 oocyte zinc finger protein XlCOF6.1-like isoform X1 [Cryptotermes secundus]XP_023703979.1 oocyte zinc finger protein XlCOF6.1-like isoform X1 [Cryptotermes secundus]XP_023703980.1 oocyte zinc finger protein XlCOF6.1-like isoform X1 [Cryptotermes secundus]